MNGTYTVSLVGEQHYQRAIEDLEEGDEVQVWHEPDNPYDELALAVSDSEGRTIGYVPKDCFLREAVHEEGKGCSATIATLEEDGRGKGFIHVQLDVEVTGPGDCPVLERGFTRS